MIGTPDLKALRGSLLLFLALALASLACIAGAWQFERAARMAHLRALLDKRSLQDRETKERADEAAYQDAAREYQAWMEAGIVGPENRSAWTAKLHQAKQQHGLPSLSYEFSPRQPIDEKPGPGAKYEIMASPMQLHMHLLHEGDLLHVLADLGLNSQALVRPRRCTLQRHIPNGTSPVFLLSADCQLDWITIREKP